MPRSLYVRDVPEHLTGWIHEERARWLMKQREFVISVLEQAYNGGHTPTLFDDLATVEDNSDGSPTEQLPFLFADLFAGIGGLRIGLERVGGRCVFSSEWDKHCQRTYAAWFGETPHGDITRIKPADIPNVDLLAAGFPCQPFSVAS